MGTAYVFTESKAVYGRFIGETSSGSVAVNDCIMQMAIEDLPFGGVGYSGMGAYKGKASFQTFSHHKSVLVRNTGAPGEKLGAIRYPPYDVEANLGRLINLLKKRPVPNIAGFLLTL